MGRLLVEAIPRNGGEAVYTCRACSTPLTAAKNLISKEFRGRSGRAYLYNSDVRNTYPGKREDRMLMTGMHTIEDVFCVGCSKGLGWRYIHAFNESQRYKVGKIILEKAYIRKMRLKRPIGGGGQEEAAPLWHVVLRQGDRGGADREEQGDRDNETGMAENDDDDDEEMIRDGNVT